MARYFASDRVRQTVADTYTAGDKFFYKEVAELAGVSPAIASGTLIEMMNEGLLLRLGRGNYEVAEPKVNLIEGEKLTVVVIHETDGMRLVKDDSGTIYTLKKVVY